jgi:hypothetical protein
MAGKVLNQPAPKGWLCHRLAGIKVCNPLKLRSGLTAHCHVICHYSYNLPLVANLRQWKLETKKSQEKKPL